MLFRIGGALLLGSVCLSLSRAAVRAEHARLCQTVGFLLLLRHVRSSISCFRTPLREIWMGFDNAALNECGFLRLLRRDGFSPALSSVRTKLYLGHEELRLLTAFGYELGKSRAEEQLVLCNYTLERLEQLYTRCREEEPRRRRVASTVILTGGLMLILVLL